MSHTPHELHEEFPEYAAIIHTLKTSDAHFTKMMDEYHLLNRQVHRAETNVEPMDDATLEGLKKQRLFLLDQIQVRLRKAC